MLSEYWAKVLEEAKERKRLRAVRRTRKQFKKKQPSTDLWDVRKSFKYHKFRERVKQQAGGYCQLCGHREADGAVLIVHHIETVKDNPKLATDQQNGLGVCSICHAEIHPWLRRTTG